MLKLLGKVGKGAATALGLGGLATGTALTLTLDPTVTEGLARVAEILQLLGALLTAFGLGRKAGYAVPDREK